MTPSDMLCNANISWCNN